MVWTPRATVAAVIERNGAFLMIEEDTDDGVRLNQPAGHLEPGESLQDAAIRETLEETAHPFHPTGWLGTYLWRPPVPQAGGDADTPTYMRFAFVGDVSSPLDRALDVGIRRAFWIGADELRARSAEHRSPLVMQCVDDYLSFRAAGKSWLPLEALYTHSAISSSYHGK
jgi:8-oxo-dGTP pyrophosphatase MutT (NUDIX family)